MQCDCTSLKGLAILPVNYCVIPRINGYELASWANHPDIIRTKLKYDYHYALRVAREGFLYLYYEEGARGTQYWEVYKIAENGTFWKQISPQMASYEEDCGCQATLENSSNAETICIEKPEQCGNVWLAYSEHKWQNDVLENYKADNQLRSKRMTLIEPRKMALEAVVDGNGIAQLNEQNLRQILDYSNLGIETKVADPSVKHFEKLVSDDINQWDCNFLNKHCTGYSWATKRKLNNTLKSAGERSTQKVGYIVGLNDAVGIAYELNGWCNEIIGYLELFNKERNHEIQSDALLTMFEKNFIEAMTKNKEILAKNEKETRKNEMKGEFYKDPNWIETKKIETKKEFAGQEAILNARLRIYTTIEKWNKYHYTNANKYKLFLMDTDKFRSEEVASVLHRRIDEYDNSVMNSVKSEEELHNGGFEKQSKKQWEKYQARINQPLRDTYNQKYKQIMDQASLLHEQRSENVFIWIQSDNYLNVLNDYSQNNIEDGIEFERIIVNALEGIVDTKIGNDIIGEWVKSYEIPKTNLIWRAVTFNQQTAIKEFEVFLADVDKYKELDNEGRLQRTLISAPSKFSGFTEICKKINESLARKKVEVGSNFLDKFAYKTDKLASILINKLSRVQPVSVMVNGMRVAADHINHFMAQKIFMIRAGLEPEVIIGVMTEYYFRRDWLDRIKKLSIDNYIFTRQFPEIHQKGMSGMLINSYLKKYTHNILRKVMVKRADNNSADIMITRKRTEMWDTYNNQQFGRNLKGARLSAVLLTLQIPVIMTLVIQKDDYTSEEFTYLILSAALGFVSTFVDVMLKPVDIAFEKTPLVTGLRAVGHFTGGVSAVFGLFYAIPQTLKKNQDKLEFVLNVSNAAVYFSQSIKCCSALLELSPKLAATFLARQIIKMAGWRLVTFFVTWEVQLLIIGFQLVWDWIVDDDIQKWVRITRFGIKYDPETTPNFESELESFKELMEIEDNQEQVDQQSEDFLEYIGWESDFLSDLDINNILNFNNQNKPISQITIPYKIN